MASKDSACEGGDVRLCDPVTIQEDKRQLTEFTILTTDTQMHISVSLKKEVYHLKSSKLADSPLPLTKSI